MASVDMTTHEPLTADDAMTTEKEAIAMIEEEDNYRPLCSSSPKESNAEKEAMTMIEEKEAEEETVTEEKGAKEGAMTEEAINEDEKEAELK